MQPSANPDSRLCLRFCADGLHVYANQQALIDLREQLTWLIESPLEERYHCHVLITMENEESVWNGKRPRNAGVRFDDDLHEMVNADIEGGECVDLTFFKASNSDLDELQVNQR